VHAPIVLHAREKREKKENMHREVERAINKIGLIISNILDLLSQTEKVSGELAG
jgi:hypothetical protein